MSDVERVREAGEALIAGLHRHAVTLGAIQEHMVAHECYCMSADSLYRLDAASADALLGLALRMQTALRQGRYEPK